MSSVESVKTILRALHHEGLSVRTFLSSVLHDKAFKSHEDVADLRENGDQLVEWLVNDTHASARAQSWAIAIVKKLCMNELKALSKKNAGTHFDASRATEEQLRAFDTQLLANTMVEQAPITWGLLGSFLESDQVLVRRRKRRRKNKIKPPIRTVTSPIPQRADAMDVDHEIAETSGSTQNDEQYWSAFPLPLPPLEPVPDEEEEGVGEAEAEAADEDVDMNRREHEHVDEHVDAGNVHSAEPGASESHSEDLEDDPEEEERREKLLLDMKSVVCMSILLNNTNQMCNTLQTMVGLFLHACNTPEATIDLLSRFGLSISRSSINNAVKNLSVEAAREIKRIGKTLLSELAYDNLEMEMKHLIPVVEKPQEALLHLTTGTFIWLEHGVTKADLCCADQLWAKSLHNPSNWRLTEQVKWLQLVGKIEKDPRDSRSLTCRQRFQKWLFLRDLVEHGPEYFRQFKETLGEPEAINKIPIVRSKQVPAKAMNVNKATIAGNLQAITDLFKQGGIGSTGEQTSPDCQDIGNHVVLVHGNLSTAERVDSLLQSRSEESTPWRRFQSVVFVMGLFHLKMACADAIWKICIQPKSAHEDKGSLMKEIAEIRPKETVKIGSNKPGFRRMHEVIQHVGITSRLDCWRVEVERAHGFTSLEDWGKSGVTWKQIKKTASKLVRNYVAGEHTAMARTRPLDERDQQNENAQQQQRLYLLYEEMSISMNSGDIGRVEECFLPWILVFRGCGKFKYASYMQHFLYDLHFVYPEALSRAIRMNILCNPTGTANGFRGIDRWVEHNNFYTKVIYGGQFSNRSIDRILDESVLIEIFKRIRISFENMFALHQRGYKHSPAQMERTFQKLVKYMRENQLNEFVAGRVTEYSVPDAIGIGLQKTLLAAILSTDKDMIDERLVIDAEDGDLDV